MCTLSIKTTDFVSTVAALCWLSVVEQLTGNTRSWVEMLKLSGNYPLSLQMKLKTPVPDKLLSVVNKYKQLAFPGKYRKNETPATKPDPCRMPNRKKPRPTIVSHSCAGKSLFCQAKLESSTNTQQYQLSCYATNNWSVLKIAWTEV